LVNILTITQRFKKTLNRVATSNLHIHLVH